MTARSPTGLLQTAGRIALLVGSFSLSGCGWLDQYRGEGFRGEDATWGEAYRGEKSKGERYFFDERSNQIERSLGV